MEVKEKRFYTRSRIERATKLLICLFVLLLINCSNVFATNQEITVDNIIQILNYFNTDGYDTTLYTEERLQEFVNTANTTQYGYIQYNKNTGLRLGYNFKPYIRYGGEIDERIEGNKRSWIYFNEQEKTYTSGTSTFGNIEMRYQKYMYCIGGWFTLGTSTIEVKDGWSNINIMTFYKEPYFIFSASKVGTTTINNKEINCYYTTSFPRWTNSYSTNREIGSLYIDKNYILEDIFYPEIYINKYNWEQSEEWNYTGYQFFKEEEVNGYLRYSISIENNLLTAPYFYNINLKSVDKNLSEDLNINFAIINENTITGPTVTTPSGEVLSGDATEDKTNLGDVLNSITEPYNPEKNILNQMKSGDILDNMGYQVTEDPNADLWDTIINGLKETLTGTGNVTLEVPLRNKTITVNSKDIKQPESELKVFTGLFVNFWLLMQMFSFIKRTIDQVNEGNLKVMHDVDADCYFF